MEDLAGFLVVAAIMALTGLKKVFDAWQEQKRRQDTMMRDLDATGREARRRIAEQQRREIAQPRKATPRQPRAFERDLPDVATQRPVFAPAPPQLRGAQQALPRPAQRQQPRYMPQQQSRREMPRREMPRQQQPSRQTLMEQTRRALAEMERRAAQRANEMGPRLPRVPAREARRPPQDDEESVVSAEERTMAINTRPQKAPEPGRKRARLFDTKQDIRRGIILAEVLGKPVSLR